MKENPPIPGLVLGKPIGHGAHSIVYRATRHDQLFAVKIMREELDNPDRAAIRFRREAGILARVRHPALPEIMEVGEVAGRPYLVMEYVTGNTLTALLENGPVAESQIICLAQAIAGALIQVHDHGLIHRDIKPANIIVDNSGQARLIDFGFAAQSGQEDKQIVGTFLYSSPEQTGMLRRPVDGRADLYALGVVLFECATGVPPFYSPDAGELMRQHAVLLPLEAHIVNPSVSPALSAIIARLLAKDPDDRYQTSAGLLADLERVEILNTAIGAGEAVLLNQASDQSDILFANEEPLFGRYIEVARLQACWRETRQGQGHVVLITGETGAGKSRLARQLLRDARQSQGLPIFTAPPLFRGRCQEGKVLPFAPLRQAVNGWLQQVAHLEPWQRQQAESRIRAAAGESAPLLQHFSPRLAAVLTGTSALSDTAGMQEQFLEAVAHFFSQIAVASGGCILFLDDIQWLDESSHRLLRHIINRVETAPLLFVAAGQEGAATVDALRHFAGEAKAPLTCLNLAPLDEPVVAHLVSHYLNGYPLKKTVIRQLAHRSNGNPLIVKEYLRLLIDAGRLRPSWGKWLVDKDAWETLDLSGSAVQVMLQRLQSLNQETQGVLSLAATIGIHFSLDLLLAIADRELEQLYPVLSEAIENCLVEQDGPDAYLFVHEQVCQTLLRRLPANRQRQLHKQLAEAIENGQSALSTEEQTYLVAHHYTLSDIEQQPERVYTATYGAGLQAFHNFAYEEAYTFLQQAQRAARLGSQPVDVAFLDTLADVCFRTGREDEAAGHIRAALATAGAGSAEQRALWRGRLAQIYLGRRENSQAWQEVEKALNELRAPIPQATPGSLLRSLGSWIRWWLADRTGWGYGRADREKQTYLKSLIKLYSIAGHAAYFADWPLVLLQAGLSLLYPAHCLGPSRQLVNAYTNYALLLAILQRPQSMERMAAKAAKAAQGLNDQVSLARNQYLYATAKHFSGDVRAAEELSRRSLDDYGRWLDAYEYRSLCSDLIFNLMTRGYAREAWDVAQRFFERMALNDKPDTEVFLPQTISILAILGRTSEARTYLEAAQARTAGIANDGSQQSFPATHQLIFYLEQGELGKPLETAIARQSQLNIRPQRAPFYVRFFYVSQAYARLAQAQTGGPDTQTNYLERLRTALGELKAVSQTPLLQGHYRVIQGGQALLEGRPQDALSHLTQAEELALETDSPWVLYEVARWRAHVLQQAGNDKAAAQQARIAYTIAQDQHWLGRVRRLCAEFHLAGSPPPISISPGTSPKTTVPDSVSVITFRLQRYLDALLQVSLASAAILDPEQQARAALDEIVRILGAERALLFIVADEDERLIFRAGRNAAGHDLSADTGYSHTVVDQVCANRQPMVISGDEEGILISSESVITQDIRSILSAPLIMQEHLMGVVYLDNRLVRGVFTQEDVQILLAIANHIAIALESARMVDVIRRQTEALQSAYHQLERLDQAKSDFIGVISHELRTPLTILDGYCQILLSDRAIANNAYHSQLLAGIHGGASRLHNIVNDMLDMAKLDNHTLQPIWQPVDLPALIALVCEQFEEALTERYLTLEIDRENLRQLPTLDADPDLLHKVFYHLVINAIKYTPDGGQIIVTGRAVPFGVNGQGEGIEVIISDTGIGIDPAYHDLVFTKFYQTGQVALHSSGKTKFKGGGPGLGLAITRGIIEAHGGQIWLESPGQDEIKCPGTSFHLHLPCRQPANAGVATSRSL